MLFLTNCDLVVIHLIIIIIIIYNYNVLNDTAVEPLVTPPRVSRPIGLQYYN